MRRKYDTLIIKELVFMNILHLKYAVEIARTKSISKAAANLYIGQPNLSRAIKELETKLGINIFVRTMRGVTVTPEGEYFLEYARRIVAQVDALENMYENGNVRRGFSIYTAYGTYIENAIVKLVKNIPREAVVDITYKEGSNDEVIDAVFSSEINLGIIRYDISTEEQYRRMLAEKKLECKSISKFEYRILMSKAHPLAQRKVVSPEELSLYTEIICNDAKRIRQELTSPNLGRNVGNRIYVSTMSVACGLLENILESYMYAGPIIEKEIAELGLISRSVDINTKEHEDLLIWRIGYNLTEIDKKFVSFMLGRDG